MVSIIIASVNAAQLAAVSKNIAQTIGLPYEIIGIANSDGAKGICEVYNEGIEQAKYDVLCFMHEDLEILTHNWGAPLVAIFDDPQIGLVGVAGSSYIPMTPSTGGVPDNSMHINIRQSFKFSDKKTTDDYINPNNEHLSEVGYVDGVFVCTTRKVVEEFQFDPTICPGFHGYDVDFSLAVGTKYKVVVTYNLLLHHFSEGNFDKKWLEAAIKVFDTWHYRLPLNIKQISHKEAILTEKRTFKQFIEVLIKAGLPVSIAFKFLFKSNIFFKFNAKMFFSLALYAFKKMRRSNSAKLRSRNLPV